MSVVAPDWMVLLASVVGLGGLLAGAEGLRLLGVSTATTRRLVHAAVCLFVAGTPWLFSGPGPVMGLSAAFVVVNGWSRGRGWWPGIHAERPESWGTVAVPLAVLPAAAVTWAVAPARVLPFQIAFFVLGLADPMAAAVGTRWGRRRFTPTATGAGTATMVIVTAGLVGGALWMVGWNGGRVLAAVLVTSVVAGAVEAIGRGGWDNLFVVIAVLVVLVPLSGASGWGGGLVLGVGVGAVVTGGAAAVEVLTRRGAVGAGLFAASLVGLGGLPWAGPGFAFFVLSSALSFLPGEAEEVGAGAPRRTLRQVLANGGGAWALLLAAALAPPSVPAFPAVAFWGFVGALAAAAADTWATELGTRYAGRPWSLRDGARVPRGTSGAVSGVGTLGAALGAASVAGVAVVGAPRPDMTLLLVGTAAGLLGMTVDGLVGATIQARYRGVQGTERETPARAGDPVRRGWRWVDNDIVNVFGTTAGALAGMGAYVLM